MSCTLTHRESRRPVRLAWLAANPLPQDVRYYSLAAFAAGPDVSLILRPTQAMLARTDPLNDSLVIVSDAIIPGSTLLGYPNADHWAVAMPFVRNNRALAALISKKHYPREILLEAAVRFVEEDLASQECGETKR